MAEIKKIISTNAPPAIGPYSQAIEANGFIFLSGQIAIEPASGTLSAGSIDRQTRQVLENIRAVLTAAGSKLEKIAATTVYLTDINDFAEMNKVYSEFFKEPFPARATVAVKELPKGAKVEIAATAVK